MTFADAAGIDESEGERVEIDDFLKDPSRYTGLGGTVRVGQRCQRQCSCGHARMTDRS